MKVLVTGSAGFIGRRLVRTLREAGARVTGIDRVAADHSDQDIVHDLTIPLAPGHLPDDIDACVHLAGEVGGFLKNVGQADIPAIDARINENVAELCRHADCRRLVFFSSINVFEVSHEFTHTALAGLDQRSHYAVSKAGGERLFAERFEHLLVVRPTNVFGRDQGSSDAERGHSHVIPELLARIDAGRDLEVLGDGSQRRNFVHVGDIARFVAEYLGAEALEGRRWLNLRSDCTLSIAELAAELCRLRGVTPQIRFRPEFQRHERLRIRDFDLGPAQAAGWAPRIHDLASGLAD
jgi:UDP-glucose 4-epimerase